MMRRSGKELRQSKNSQSSPLWDNWEDVDDSQNTSELQNILANFQKPFPLPTEEILRSCIGFASSRKHLESDGEKYLRAIAVLNFFDGLFAESAKAAGILADAYFIDASAETRGKSNYFNKIAAKSYALAGDVDQACHYYNQFLARAKNIKSYHADDVSEAVIYLLDNHKLICTSYLLEVMQNILANNADNLVKSREFSRLIARAENNTLYENISQLEAKKNLTAAVDMLKKQLVELTAKSKTMAGTMFSPANEDAKPDLSSTILRP